jgi:hypothetical protein
MPRRDNFMGRAFLQDRANRAFAGALPVERGKGKARNPVRAPLHEALLMRSRRRRGSDLEDPGADPTSGQSARVRTALRAWGVRRCKAMLDPASARV